MNKKISTEIAVGIILIVAVIMVSSSWLSYKQTEQSSNVIMNQLTKNIQTQKCNNENKKISDFSNPNPASAYCAEKGGELEIRTSNDGGQIGYCVFADGKECEEWEYYQGDCSENISIQELDFIAKNMIANKQINKFLQYLCHYDEINCGSNFFYTGQKFGDDYRIAFLSNLDEEAWKNDPFKYSSEIFFVNIKNGDVCRVSPFAGGCDNITRIRVDK